MFATEPVSCASLSGALVSERRKLKVSSGRGAYALWLQSKRDLLHSRDIELDQLEIQKGFLQVAKGLEILA